MSELKEQIITHPYYFEEDMTNDDGDFIGFDPIKKLKKFKKILKKIDCVIELCDWRDVEIYFDKSSISSIKECIKEDDAETAFDCCFDHIKYRFKTKDDAMLFKLRFM